MTGLVRYNSKPLSEHVDAPILGPPSQVMAPVWFSVCAMALTLFGGGYIALSVVSHKFDQVEARLELTNDKTNRAVTRNARLQDRVNTQAKLIEQLQVSAPEERTALLAMYRGLNAQMTDTLRLARASRIPVEERFP